jgi:hypothetical protein
MIPVATIISFAMKIVEFFIAKSKDNAKLHAAFVSLAKELRSAGIADVRSRLEAESQIAAGSDEWDQREKNKSNNSGGGPSA